MSHDPKKLVEKVATVASLPQIFIKVDETINDPNSSSADLANVISGDPSMSVRLLRLANSSLYNFVNKVETVTQAITVMGTHQLRDLVLACSVLKLFKNIPEEFVTMESFWRHCIACGTAARLIGKRRKDPNLERLFVAGLLHDIGRLILLMELPDEFQKIVTTAREQKKPLFEVEKEVLGFDHAELGGLMIRSWKLSDALEQQITHHHHPENAKCFSGDAEIIHVSDIIANALALGTSGEILVPKIRDGAWESFGIHKDDIDDLMDELEVQYEDAIKFILGNA